MTSPAEITTGKPGNAREISSAARSIPRPAKYCLSRLQNVHFHDGKALPQCTHDGAFPFDDTKSRPPHSHEATLRQWAHSNAFP